MSSNTNSNRWTKSFFFVVVALSLASIAYSYDFQTHDYQLIQLGDFRRDQFLIDKKTGRTWIAVCVGESKGSDCEGDLVWQERVAVGLNGYTNEDLKNYANRLSELKKTSK